MRKTSTFLFGGLGLLLVGLLLAVQPFSAYWHGRHLPPQVAVSPFTAVASAATPPVYEEGSPVRIQIPSLGIDLPVINGYYNTTSQTWTLTKDKVQYATITPLPNNKQGNTFLYGHNRPGVFNTLNQIKLGDEVILTTSNAHVFTYRFTGALQTNPNDDSLFHYQGKPILTIQTCSGAWYQYRQLFTFDLESVQ